MSSIDRKVSIAPDFPPGSARVLVVALLGLVCVCVCEFEGSSF